MRVIHVTVGYILVTFGIFLGAGCKNPAEQNSNPQSMTFQFDRIPANRVGEVYALWVEVPKQVASQKGPSIQHGFVNTILISQFTVDDQRVMHGFDTSGMSKRIGVNYDLIVRAELSVESAGQVGASPSNDFLIGDVTGTTNIGTATLKASHPFAFGDSIAGTTSWATLASSAATPADAKGEVYLMNATSPTSIAPGLMNAPQPTYPWQFGCWTVDSTKGTPAYTFLGKFSTASGHDSQSQFDHFIYPGGRTPGNVAQPITDLTAGRAAIMITLEPSLNADPATPFPLIVCYGTVPKACTAFQPFMLQNMSAEMPQITVTILR